MTTFNDAVYCLAGKQRIRWSRRGGRREKQVVVDVRGVGRSKKKPRFSTRNRGKGAGDGTRTHDNLLGKQALYQLSYTRSPIKSIAFRLAHVYFGASRSVHSVGVARPVVLLDGPSPIVGGFARGYTAD